MTDREEFEKHFGEILNNIGANVVNRMFVAWQAAQAAQAEYIAHLELNNKFKDDAIAQLQADNAKLREALGMISISASISSAEPTVQELDKILDTIADYADNTLEALGETK